MATLPTRKALLRGLLKVLLDLSISFQTLLHTFHICQKEDLDRRRTPRVI